MPKGGRGSSMKSTPVMNNGGIMGSGIFGMFGSTVMCKADDNSMFCTLTKLFNVIIMIGFLLFILYIIYMIFKHSTGNKSNVSGGAIRKRGRRL